MQARQLEKLVSKLDTNKFDIMTYTGFEYEYLVKNASEENGYMELLKLSDILIDGKFDISKKSGLIPFRGSTNQRAINVKESLKEERVTLYDFEKGKVECFV